MGCLGFARYTKPTVPKKDGTTLVEMEIHNITDAHYIGGLQPFGFTPIVLVPSRTASVCCCGWYQEIPEGFNAIVVRLGKDLGVYSPGFHYMPPWMRVTHLVTKQLVVFDTPVKDCKTADNVTVNLDVMILFEILDGHTFVFNLGPEKLDGLMRAAQEEALRAMASSVTADRVLELQGSNTDNIVAEMNQKFTNNYGVKIHDMTVKHVQLPRDLMDTLQKKTIFVSKEIEAVRQQELKVMVMNNDNERRKMDGELLVETQQAEELFVTAKAKLSQEIANIRSTAMKEVTQIQAEGDAERNKLLSQAEVEIAKMNMERDQVSREVQLESAQEKRDILSDAHAYKKNKLAETNYSCSEARARALDSIAEAEGYAAEGFKSRRDYDVAREKLAIYDALAKNKNIKIASSTENLMGLAPRNDAVTQVVQKAISVANIKLSQLAGETPSQHAGASPGRGWLNA